MIWTTVMFCVVGLWGMLAVFSGERKRQLTEKQDPPPPAASKPEEVVTVK